MKKFKKLIEIFDSIIILKTITQWILSSIFIVIILIYISKYFNNKYPIQNIYNLCSIILIFLLLFTTLFFKNKRKKDVYVADYEIISKHLYYEYKSDIEMTYKKNVMIKALRNGVDSLKDKYFWTGNGKTNIISAKPGQKFVPTTQKTIYQFYEIHFEEPLKCNESIDTELIWTLEDTNKTAMKFLSTTIEEPCKKLIFTLKLNVECSNKKAHFSISKNQGGAPIDWGSLNFDEDGKKVVWEISSPKLFHYYELRWE